MGRKSKIDKNTIIELPKIKEDNINTLQDQVLMLLAEEFVLKIIMNLIQKYQHIH